MNGADGSGRAEEAAAFSAGVRLTLAGRVIRSFGCGWGVLVLWDCNHLHIRVNHT